ncbi:MAG TPA: amidohydrolase, partial [Kofleriaceae bacterium]|nr:amidohydrolase [Kofleriaceae bacterium]
MRWLIVFAVACSSSTSQHRADQPPAGHELMLVGGDIITMDPAHPHATSVAWDAQGRITGVDDDPRQHPNARIIELHGHSVTPGLIDAHCHLYGLGTDLESVSVRGAADERAAAALIASASGADGWMHGQGWDQNKWPGQQFPTKATLDAVVADRPALVERVDGHASWVNSRTLALAGITAATPDPEGGKIVRDARGEPTGVLVDNAQALVSAKLPVATPALRAKRITAAAKLAIAKGITAIHEMGIADETAAVYRGLAENQQLPLRVYAFLHGDPDHPEALATRHPAPAMGRFQMRGVKFFVDGALGSRGARLKAPYTDDPKNQGLWVTPPDKLAVAIKDAVAGGWDIAVHAIGDDGVHAVLAAFAEAPPHDVNLRVEHTQVIAPDDVDLMVKTHAIASMQPTHATSDMPWAEARLGPTRILGAYAWRTMLDHHIPLIGGSDFPVEEVGPLLGIYAAVTRQDAAGNPPGGWYPAQRMTLDEAIAAFTRDAAAAEHV